MEQITVAPLEIEGVGQRLAHPGVLEQRPAQVVREALHPGRQLVGKSLFFHQSPTQRRKLVASRPLLGDVLDPQIVGARLERLQRHGDVAVIVVAQATEIIQTPIDRQILAPVVRIALVHDKTSRLEPLDPVRAAGDRRFQGRHAKIAVSPVFLGKHRHLAHD